ncbi:MAG: protein kinase [Candidatus Algichlamydia australiensis]|nr:protein kinase [Chlamydiales bacterium]
MINQVNPFIQLAAIHDGKILETETLQDIFSDRSVLDFLRESPKEALQIRINAEKLCKKGPQARVNRLSNSLFQFNEFLGIRYSSRPPFSIYTHRNLKEFFSRFQTYEKLGDGGESNVLKCSYNTENGVKYYAYKDLVSERNTSSYKLSKKRIEREWNSLLQYGNYVNKAYIAIARDQNGNVCVIDAEKIEKFYEDPSLLGKNTFELLGALSEYHSETKDLMNSLAEGLISKESVPKIVYQIILATIAMHEKGVMHCDLKLDNVLLLPNGDIKIIDFGASGKIEKNKKRRSFVGTKLYMPPKLIFNTNSEYSSKRDIFSIGQILYSLLTGYFSYPASDDFDLLLLSSEMCNKKIGPSQTPEFTPIKDKNAQDLFEKLTAYSEEDRIGLKQALEHPYFDGVRDQFQNSSASF